MPHGKAPESGGEGALRRGPGELESAVLAVLWRSGEPLSPAQVRDRLAGDGVDRAGELSYSTVGTILSRLCEKQALTRQRDGRSFRYAPVADEAGLAARQLSALLDRAPDRAAVLSRFVQDLSGRDDALLRRLLGASRAGTERPNRGAEG